MIPFLAAIGALLGGAGAAGAGTAAAAGLGAAAGTAAATGAGAGLGAAAAGAGTAAGLGAAGAGAGLGAAAGGAGALGAGTAGAGLGAAAGGAGAATGAGIGSFGAGAGSTGALGAGVGGAGQGSLAAAHAAGSMTAPSAGAGIGSWMNSAMSNVGDYVTGTGKESLLSDIGNEIKGKIGGLFNGGGVIPPQQLSQAETPSGMGQGAAQVRPRGAPGQFQARVGPSYAKGGGSPLEGLSDDQLMALMTRMRGGFNGRIG